MYVCMYVSDSGSRDFRHTRASHLWMRKLLFADTGFHSNIGWYSLCASSPHPASLSRCLRRAFPSPSALYFLTAMTTSALSVHPHLTKRGRHWPRAIVHLVSIGYPCKNESGNTDIATKGPESCDRRVKTLSELKST